MRTSFSSPNSPENPTRRAPTSPQDRPAVGVSWIWWSSGFHVFFKFFVYCLVIWSVYVLSIYKNTYLYIYMYMYVCTSYVRTCIYTYVRHSSGTVGHFSIGSAWVSGKCTKHCVAIALSPKARPIIVHYIHTWSWFPQSCEHARGKVSDTPSNTLAIPVCSTSPMPQIDPLNRSFHIPFLFRKERCCFLLLPPSSSFLLLPPSSSSLLVLPPWTATASSRSF